MDNLARNAFMARQAGMSYGKWKAMQPIVPVVKKETEETKKMKVCPRCGEKFVPNRFNVRQKYCNTVCQRAAYYENNKAKHAEWQNNCRKRKEAIANEGI